MTKPMIRIHDIATDEIIDREMTDAEFEIHQAEQAVYAAEAAAIAEAEAVKEATKQAAQAKLEALGLTTDDLKALGLGTN
jgi:hypothetical protein